MRTILACALVLLVLVPGCKKQQESREVQQAKGFITAMSTGDYAGAAGRFDANMQAAMPVDSLKEAWLGVEGQVGKFTRYVNTTTDQTTENGKVYTLVVVTCQFEKGKIDVKTVFDADGKLAGLWFAPPQQ